MKLRLLVHTKDKTTRTINVMSCTKFHANHAINHTQVKLKGPNTRKKEHQKKWEEKTEKLQSQTTEEKAKQEMDKSGVTDHRKTENRLMDQHDTKGRHAAVTPVKRHVTVT